MLQGKKTYLVGIAMVLYGVALVFSGDSEQGMKSILEGLGIVALRAGVTKSGEVAEPVEKPEG